MMLVDSSVWIDFFAARPTPQTDMLRASLGKRRVLAADLVIVEVLQGVRSDHAFALTRDLLLTLDIVDVAGAEVAVEAAQNYRFLRGKGITVRKTIDTLIATRCILDRLPLLYSDRDFDPFVAHLGLRSVMDVPTGVA
ncbi:MAG TPA: PIN domain-containing protein [Sphingomonas sp.]|jgi:hypothetical protein|nr:PIN domain-containing protein [Sphingomonas sp.]